jgi:hypothetical protein
MIFPANTYYRMADIDPKRRKLVAVGSQKIAGLLCHDLSKPGLIPTETLTTKGDNEIE